MCQMEPVLRYTASSLSPDRKQSMEQVPVGTQLTNQYLTSNVDQTWHVFTPMQANNGQYAPRDHTTMSSYGNYLLLTGQNAYDRGVVITPQYSISAKGYLCFSFAVYKPSSSVLEVYQAEPGQRRKGVKIYEIRTSVEQWRVINLKVYPMSNSSKLIYFYLVSLLKY